MCSSSNGRYTAIVAIRRFFLSFFFFSSLSFSIFFHLWTNIAIQWHLRRLRIVPLSWIEIYHFGERTSLKFYYFHWLCSFRSIWDQYEFIRKGKNTRNLRYLEAAPWRADCGFIRSSSNLKPWLIYAHHTTWIAGVFFASEREVICDFMRNVRSPIRPTRLDPRHVQPRWNIDTDRVSDGFKACRLRCTSRREILLS